LPEIEQLLPELRILRFDAAEGWRSAVAAYQRAFPEAFRVRVPRQGLWMPFQAVSGIRDWEDFGFAFKEGDDETAWDDAHGLLTFRYTEPLTWWMPLKAGAPWTMAAAEVEARRRAAAGEAPAKALLASGFWDENGGLVARMRHEPWNDGAVWSMNSSPNLNADPSDYSIKFNAAIRDALYGPGRKADLDGEYVDSIEGYVTDTLDFRREHFALAATPPVFSLETRQPALFKGLIVQEYLRALAEAMHGLGKYTMANGTPADLCWLAPWLDVMGTEWDWNPGGEWRPMPDAELMIRRVLCGGKPYCFLMNTNFDTLPPDRVALYMKRCLAYGMFPGFFSPDAAGGHYFTRPELYDRDRPLFKKYVPLIRRIAEAGWRPVAGAKAQDEGVYVERFGDGLLTVYNDTGRARRTRVVFPGAAPSGVKDLVADRTLTLDGDALLLTLDAGDVALLEVPQASQSSTTPIAPERSSSSMR
ncbi:MAG: hypothetical protein AAB368_12760, partial [bacterium]